MVPPIPPCLDHDAYLPMKDPRFSSQDYELNQPQKTLAYAKALQHWADLANPIPSDKSHQLAEYIKELTGWMEQFTTFINTQVFDLVEPSNWVWITPTKSRETIQSCPPRNTVVLGVMGLGQEAWDPPEV